MEWLLPMLALLLASAVFSGAESSLIRLSGQGLQRVPANARELLSRSSSAFAVILVGNLLAHLSFLTFVVMQTRGFEFGQALLWHAAGVVALALFGEILPRQLARRAPLAAARWILPLIVTLHRTCERPAVWLSRPWSRPGKRRHAVESEEVQGILAHTDRAILDDEQQGLLKQVLELGSLRAGAVRRPLHKMVQVPLEMPLAKAERQLRERHAAWAAVVDAAGEVQGVLDLTRMPRGRKVRDGMRTVPVLPELAPVAAGVPLLRERGAPFVLLVDEYGVGTGVIERGRWADTLLDRIPAAHGADYASAVLDLGESQFLIDANLPLHDFVDRFGDPGDVDPRTETILGFAEERLGRLLGPADAFGFVAPEACFDLKVVRCDGERPVRLELTLHPKPEVET